MTWNRDGVHGLRPGTRFQAADHNRYLFSIAEIAGDGNSSTENSEKRKRFEIEV